jgi:CheY-like chemotaxis protein
MNLEKYDLVLMDIVMPKLDGVSATSLIRKFDQGTPIISMTSNSKPNEIMTYYSSGMNDILPKPFTKEGLLDMLEVRNKVYHDSRDVSPIIHNLETLDASQGNAANVEVATFHFHPHAYARLRVQFEHATIDAAWIPLF